MIFKTTFLFLIFLTSQNSLASRLYFNKFLGHVHKNPSEDSSSETIVQCAHSVKVLPQKNPIEGWTYVEVGEDKGYVQSEFLSLKREECFQEKYPKFYLGLDLDITEMYFWGKLNDHYTQGTSRAK